MKSLLFTIALVALLPNLIRAEVQSPQSQFFENHIRPILVQHCYDCHSREADTTEGGLRLDVREGWERGGDSGAAILPGKPETSLLIEAVSFTNVDLQMPPDGKLSETEIALLRKWIASGAFDPRVATDDMEDEGAFDLAKRRDQHWCWQPMSAVNPPASTSTWPSRGIDNFILKQLDKQGLSPAEPAGKRTFIRRASFAIVGLPPTPAEIDNYLEDNTDDATERMIDRLLESPHFGEHWGQHWLDLMRFAETRGHEQDFAIPEAFRYRDYVIHALNEDVPYDQFVTEHVAGDLMPEPRLHAADHSNQSVQGTGFWQLHDATHSPVDICGDEALRFQNQIDVFSRSFLGLSLGCARCHDHKFDAISAADYYAMYGYLQSSSYHLANVANPAKLQQAIASLRENSAEYQQRLRALLSDRLESNAQELPRYLECASQVAAEAIDSKEVPKSIADLARERQLNVATLWELAKYLHGEVASDSPLKLWSEIAKQKHDEVSKIAREQASQLALETARNAEAWSQLGVVQSVKDGERNYQPKRRSWSQSDVIEEFNSSMHPHWIVGGTRFGDGPVQIGQMVPVLDAGESTPSVWFADESAAASETLSSLLTGLVRTRTFEVTGDKIWYRYRGQGEAFVAVDSHRVVAGPLHGGLKKKLSDKERQGWKWGSQNLRDYVGHRVHVEFTGGAGFAVDRVIFADQQPPKGEPVAYSFASVKTRAELSERTTQRFRKVGARLAANNIGQQDAQFLNWWLAHSALFPPANTAAFDKAAKEFVSQKNAAEATLPSPVFALSLLDGSGENEQVHIRGNHRNRSKHQVPRGLLTALEDPAVMPNDAASSEEVQRVVGSGRLELAHQLTRTENPLLSRVYVNRIWHHLFGRGIVETVDDFGVMGKEPTHPELLDYIARQFMENGWSTKWLIRELMLSSTYRMSSRPDAGHQVIDPTNRYWHRMPIRRLTGETIRDHLLAVSGSLNPKHYGPSVKVHITPYMRGNRTPQGSGPLDGNGRRSIYTEVRRNHLPAFLAAFDKPPPFMAIGRRTVSNSPTQSLILMNDPLVHEQALLWAKRILAEASSEKQRVGLAFALSFSRPPDMQERDAALAFVRQQRSSYEEQKNSNGDSAEVLAWRDFCHTLVNVKEFIHVN